MYRHSQGPAARESERGAVRARDLLLVTALLVAVGLLAWLTRGGPSSPAPAEVAFDAPRGPEEGTLSLSAPDDAGPRGARGLEVSARGAAIPVGVRLRGPGRLEGRVIDRASALGVGGLRVDLLPVPPAGATLLGRMLRMAGLGAGIDQRTRPIAVAETRPDGGFAFEDVRCGGAYVDVRGAYHVPENATFARVLASGAGGPIEVWVRSGGRVLGRVVAPDGAAAANAKVMLSAGPTHFLESARSGDLRWLEGEADARGEFVFEGVAPGEGYEISVSGRGFALSHALDVLVRAGQDTDVTVATRRGGTLAGRVYSARPAEEGEAEPERVPIGGAHLGVVPRGLRDLRCAEEILLATHAESAPDGSFTLHDVPPGEVDVLAMAPGHLAALGARVAVADEATTVVPDVLLAPGTVIRGRVVDEQGAPLEGVLVRWNPIDLSSFERDLSFAPMLARGLRGLEFPRTDAEGRFQAGPCGDRPPWRLQLVREGFAAKEARVEESDPALATEDGVTLVLQRGGAVEGVVIDFARAEPVTAFTVRSPHQGDGEAGSPSAQNPFSGGVSVEDPAGRFRIDSLRPGNVELDFEAPGHLPLRVKTTVTAGATTQGVIVKLEPGARIRGVVEGPDGEPVAGAQVVAVGAENSPSRSARPRVRGAPVPGVGRVPFGSPEELPAGLRPFAANLGLFAGRSALSNARGEFELSGVEPVATRVEAFHREWAGGGSALLTLAAGATEENVRVTMERGGGLAGVVRDRHGRPVPGGIVVALAPSAFAGGSGPIGGTIYQDGTDAEGAYRIAPMVSGSYFVVVTRGDTALDPLSFLGTLNLDLVSVPADEVATHDLVDTSAAACRVHGRVSYRDVPVESGTLVAVGFESESLLGVELKVARIGTGGRFEFAGLAPGEYRIDVQGGAHDARVVLEVPDQPELEVELRLPDGGIEALVLEESSGVPIAGMRVTLEDTSRPQGGGLLGQMLAREGRRRSAECDEKGRVLFSGLSAGNYRLSAGGDADHAPAELLVEVSEDRIERDVELLLAAALSIEGFVRDAKSLPIRGARVAVSRAGSVDVAARANGDESGRFVLRGLAPGPYTLSAEAPGFARARGPDVELARSGGAREPVEIRLVPGVAVRVRIRDGTGRPVTGALAVLVRAGESLPSQAASPDRVLESFLFGANGSDGEGLLDLGRHEAGEYRLLAQRGISIATSEVRIPADVSEIELSAELP